MAGTNYYNILGCEETASHDTIKKCYHEKALEAHPDKRNDNLGSASFNIINKAWKTLSDPAARKVYDAKLNEERSSQIGQVFGTFSCDEMVFDSSEESYSLVCRCGGLFVVDANDLKQNEDCDVLVDCNSCSLLIFIKHGSLKPNR